MIGGSDEIGFNRLKRLFLSIALAGSWLVFAAPQCFPAPAQEKHKEEKQAEPPVSPAEARKNLFNHLFAQLKAAPDAASAAQTRELISRIWAHSDSPTADLLMSRAENAMTQGQQAEAAALFDRIVGLYPDWGYGWRRRAQLTYAMGDSEGAMLDLQHALSVEPRDFLAMNELAVMMREQHQDRQALEMMRRALMFDPANASLRAETDKLEREVEGRDI